MPIIKPTQKRNRQEAFIYNSLQWILRVRTKATTIRVQNLGRLDRAGLRKKWGLLKSKSRVFTVWNWVKRGTKNIRKACLVAVRWPPIIPTCSCPHLWEVLVLRFNLVEQIVSDFSQFAIWLFEMFAVVLLFNFTMAGQKYTFSRNHSPHF